MLLGRQAEAWTTCVHTHSIIGTSTTRNAHRPRPCKSAHFSRAIAGPPATETLAGYRRLCAHAQRAGRTHNGEIRTLDAPTHGNADSGAIPPSLETLFYREDGENGEGREG